MYKYINYGIFNSKFFVKQIMLDQLTDIIYHPIHSWRCIKTKTSICQTFKSFHARKLTANWQLSQETQQQIPPSLERDRSKLVSILNRMLTNLLRSRSKDGGIWLCFLRMAPIGGQIPRMERLKCLQILVFIDIGAIGISRSSAARRRFSSYQRRAETVALVSSRLWENAKSSPRCWWD